MLLLIKVNLILKKKRRKRNLIWFDGSCNGKIVLILLTEVIALNMRPIIVDV